MKTLAIALIFVKVYKTIETWCPQLSNDWHVLLFDQELKYLKAALDKYDQVLVLISIEK